MDNRIVGIIKKLLNDRHVDVSEPLRQVTDKLGASERCEALRILCRMIALIASHGDCSQRDEIALNFVRFVNVSFLPGGARRRDAKRTLYSYANELGFPEWLIELRHDISHKASMPSYELIAQASESLMAWLLHDGNFGKLFNPQRWNEARDGKNACENARSFLKGHLTMTSELSARKNHQSRIMEKRLARYTCASSELASCLCEDGYLFPTWKQLLAKSISDPIGRNGLPHEQLTQQWGSLLSYLAGSRPDFLECLLENLSKRSVGPAKRLALAWLAYILNRYGPSMSRLFLVKLAHKLLSLYRAGVVCHFEQAEMLCSYLIGTSVQPLVRRNKRKNKSARKTSQLWTECSNEEDKYLCTYEERADPVPVECEKSAAAAAAGQIEAAKTSLGSLCFPFAEKVNATVEFVDLS